MSPKYIDNCLIKGCCHKRVGLLKTSKNGKTDHKDTSSDTPLTTIKMVKQASWSRLRRLKWLQMPSSTFTEEFGDVIIDRRGIEN